MKRARGKYDGLRALHDRVAKRPRVAAYLASERRIPFNEDGIFRHYPELDGAR
jgi:glutathione S-transferase